MICAQPDCSTLIKPSYTIAKVSAKLIIIIPARWLLIYIQITFLNLNPYNIRLFCVPRLLEIGPEVLKENTCIYELSPCW